MSKDFKKQTTTSSNLGQYGLGWMLGGIAIGLLVGLAIYALAHKNNPDTTQLTQATAATPGVGTAEAASASSAPAASNPANPSQADTGNGDNPGFIYHAVLPQLEMGVPVSAQTPPAPAKALTSAKPTEAVKPVAPTAPIAAKPVAPTPTNTAKPVALTAPAAAAIATTPEAKSASKLTGPNGYQIGAYKTTDQAAAMQERLKGGGINSQMVKATVNGEIWYRVRVGPADSNETLHKWQQTLSGMGISPLGVHM